MNNLSATHPPSRPQTIPTTSATPPMVKVEDLVVKFGEFYAVKHVNFAVTPGEIFGFLGANGAGKTTTIRVLCGLLVPTAGRAQIDGLAVTEEHQQQIKSKVGYMSQKFTLYPDLTVLENLNFAAAIRRIPDTIYQQRRRQLLDFIEFKQKPNAIVSSLPGGIKQEIALVAALLHDPKIIFLDEPTAGVAPVARARFWALIRQLANAGKTIFVTTHYMDEAENCQRVALMRAGELIALDSPQRLKRQTYQRTIYLIKVQDRTSYTKIQPLARKFSLWEAYGRHFHGIVDPRYDETQVVAEVAQICPIEPVQPSLEDVFVKLVEGDNR